MPVRLSRLTDNATLVRAISGAMRDDRFTCKSREISQNSIALRRCRFAYSFMLCVFFRLIFLLCLFIDGVRLCCAHYAKWMLWIEFFV